jgi:mediator of RNA polymerase II transcription subunit 12
MSRDIMLPEEFIQDQLFDWLDSSDMASSETNVPMVAFTFGNLVECGLFSYANYIQRLIARGEPGLSLAAVSNYFARAVLCD